MAGSDNLKPIRTTARAKELGAKGGSAKKGSKHISTHIQEMLNDPNFELKLRDGTVLKGAPMEAVIKTAISKAISGDMRAFDILAKRGWGDKLDLTSGGNEIKTALVKFIDEPDDSTDTE